MQIEQEQNRCPYPQAPVTDHPARSAPEHVAAFRTELALTRWTRGGDIPHVFSSARTAPLRAAWYAQAQRQFDDWLQGGGFHCE